MKPILLRARSFALAGLGSLGANAVIVAVYAGELPSEAQVPILLACFGLIFAYTKLTDDKDEAIDKFARTYFPDLLEVIQRGHGSGIDRQISNALTSWASARVRREALGDTVDL